MCSKMCGASRDELTSGSRSLCVRHCWPITSSAGLDGTRACDVTSTSPDVTPQDTLSQRLGCEDRILSANEWGVKTAFSKVRG